MKRLDAIDTARHEDAAHRQRIEHDLLTLKADPLGSMRVELTRQGIDVAEYTVPVEPGIARPAKG